MGLMGLIGPTRLTRAIQITRKVWDIKRARHHFGPWVDAGELRFPMWSMAGRTIVAGEIEDRECLTCGWWERRFRD